MIMRSIIFAVFITTLLVRVESVVAQQVAIPLSPQLKVIIEPSHVLRNGAYVQGQVLLRVLLTSPFPFAAIDFSMPEIIGAHVVTLIKPKTRTIHFYEKTGYAHETRLSLFPQKSGILVVPPITIKGEITNEAGESEFFDLSNPEVEIPVHPVNPDLGASWWMVADAVEITESWTPEPDQFRVGDTVRRHIKVIADGISVEQLPHIEQSANQGYAIAGAWQDGKTDRTKTGLVAQLQQTWDLRIQSGEVMYISPIEIHYWDAVANQPAVARLPSKRVEPLARDPEAMRRNLVDAAMAKHQGRRLGVILLLALPATACLLLLIFVFLAVKPTAADRRLLADCRSDLSAVKAFSAVLRWSQESFGLRGARSLFSLGDRLSAAGRDPLATLEAAVFDGKGRLIDNRAVARGVVSAARRRRVHALFRRLMRILGTS